MARSKTVIRKYGDRRLYDTGSSRYVKLEDIARMIREGAEVEVVDARTGRNLTRAVLTQIVVEEARGPETGLPLELLRQLVVASDRATHEFISWYLNGTMELYQKAREAFEARLSDARRAVTSPLEFVRGLVGAPESSAEIEQLRLRVEELEARLATRRPPAPRPSSRRRHT